MPLRILLMLLLAVGIGSSCATQPEGSYTLYLVRHSEKRADEGKDPGLTDAGRYRSEQLALWLQDKGIRKIWSSDYRRSRNTATPLLSTLALELTLYDPGDLPALANKLRESHQNALVVGHSNTTPDLTRLLCQCVISDMDESEYNLLYVVSVSRNETKVDVLQQSVLFAY